MNVLTPAMLASWTRYSLIASSIAAMLVTKGATTWIDVSEYARSAAGRGKMASAAERRKLNPEVGGIPGKICGLLEQSDG